MVQHDRMNSWKTCSHDRLTFKRRSLSTVVRKKYDLFLKTCHMWTSRTRNSIRHRSRINAGCDTWCCLDVSCIDWKHHFYSLIRFYWYQFSKSMLVQKTVHIVEVEGVPTDCNPYRAATLFYFSALMNPKSPKTVFEIALNLEVLPPLMLNIGPADRLFST